MREKYFKILAPFTHIEDIKVLKEAGADELYCGYISKELAEKWPPAFLTINRRGEGQSFESYEDFQKALRRADKYRLPVYVTVNGQYTIEQYPLLLGLIKKIEPLEGIKGIIIADLAFLLTLKEAGFKKEIHMSVGATCFNSSTADFYRALGADRVILPRELTSTEIGEIIRGLKSNIDIEIFIIAEGCGGFIDGFCNFFHCFEGELKDKGKSMGKPVFFRTSYNTEQPNRGCIFYFSKMRKKHYKIINLRPNKERIKLSYQKNKDRSFGCRICDLYDLKTYPIQSLKIIGRGNNCLYTAKLIRTVRTAISYLENNNIPKKDFRLKCRDLFSKKILKNKRRCTKFDCYFNHHWIRTDHEEVGA